MYVGKDWVDRWKQSMVPGTVELQSWIRKSRHGSYDLWHSGSVATVALSPVPSRSSSTFPLFPSLFRLSPILPVPAPAIMTCQGLLRYDHESGLERDSETLLTVPTRLAVQWTYVLGGRSQEVIVIRKGNAV